MTLLFPYLIADNQQNFVQTIKAPERLRLPFCFSFTEKQKSLVAERKCIGKPAD
jgi:hypothetical protein